MNSIKNLGDFAFEKLIIREAHMQILNLEDNIDSTLINHCFHEIQHIKNIKIRDLGSTRANFFDSRTYLFEILGFL